MAGIITISPGHDASYPWRQIGTGFARGRASETRTEYYLSPADKGGEPPGIWHGDGLADLGLHDGQVIDREVFERLYGQFIDPRDPRGEVRLGRAPQQFRSAEQICAALLAMEPEATAERQSELLIEAKSQVRMPVQYFDVTFSASKSITLLHASAQASAASAAAAGDLASARYWEEAAAEVWECIQAGNRAALEYLQREAGYTRSGYHGREHDGLRVGRWEDAHGFIVGSFAQHTSRDGDPQLHVHNLVLNRVMRERDGVYRTLDSRALYEHRGAAAAIATLVMESALSRRFGVGWVGRADGHGREIRGVSRALMDEFSSRRQSISALTARLATEFQAQHGHAPDTRALGNLRRWANHASRRAKPAEPLDLATEARRWAAQARASEAGALEPLIGKVTTRQGPAAPAVVDIRPISELAPEQEQELMAVALARLQQAQPTWRKSDLVRHLGELLSDDVACRDDATAAQLLLTMADRVLAGEAGERVVALEPPEWPRVPDMLRRADGRSIYEPHSGVRYATAGQLRLEERLAAEAQEPGAPRIATEKAAQLLGADLAQLEAQLQDTAQDASPARPVTRSGLRLDQAAAAFLVLTSDRRAEILVGPAGSGKTRTAAAIADLWRDAGMGTVYGLTTSQAARNVLRDAGVKLAFNTAEFLSHIARGPGSGGRRPLVPETLLILDEASMMSIVDLAAIMSLAADRNCRVLITGDHEQLPAVEGGGGMTMLARLMGYVQLADPVRFNQPWEREASLRLRSGDLSVLAQYEEHGRLRGGDPEEAMERACRAFVADHLYGRDALLLARTSAQALEMSRRVQGYLRHLGVVEMGTQVRLRYGAVASRGDLIVARRNNRQVIAGQPGRWLTNRDVLRIVDIKDHAVLVRRVLRRASGGSDPLWSAPFEVQRAYLFRHCDLAYATTAHAVQGTTVDTAHVLVDGLGDRQGLYVAMSRGRDANFAYCVTAFPSVADVREGSRAAPEMRRFRRLQKERQGESPGPECAAQQESVLDPAGVVARVMQHDGTVLSATEVLRSALSDADHLGVLGVIWYDLVRRAQARRFECALRYVIPTAAADAALRDPACAWLWRSLREAESVGLGAEVTLANAVALRSLTGARDIARVIDARIRWILQDNVLGLRGSWSSRVPQMGDSELDRFMTELAAAMDERVRRIGQHAAQTHPAWATQALGDVPVDPVERTDWEERASRIGTYRELYGYDAADDAIGPEPPKTSPETRADWHDAFAALGPVDGLDLRGCSDGQLMLRLAAYRREMNWAPAHVGDELRRARMQIRTAFENAVIAEHEAISGNDPATTKHFESLATTWRALEAKSTHIADLLAVAQETRKQWDAFTEPTRHAALAAEVELRRRHPGIKLDPLGFAEPLPAASTAGAAAKKQSSSCSATEDADGFPTTGTTVASSSAVVLAPQLRDRGNWTLDLIQSMVHQDVLERVQEICENARQIQGEIDKLRTMAVFAEDDFTQIGVAWPSLGGRNRSAIVQPPRPEIIPAFTILRRLDSQRDDIEAEVV